MYQMRKNWINVLSNRKTSWDWYNQMQPTKYNENLLQTGKKERA